MDVSGPCAACDRSRHSGVDAVEMDRLDLLDRKRADGRADVEAELVLVVVDRHGRRPATRQHATAGTGDGIAQQSFGATVRTAPVRLMLAIASKRTARGERYLAARGHLVLDWTIRVRCPRDAWYRAANHTMWWSMSLASTWPGRRDSSRTAIASSSWPACGTRLSSSASPTYNSSVGDGGPHIRSPRESTRELALKPNWNGTFVYDTSVARTALRPTDVRRSHAAALSTGQCDRRPRADHSTYLVSGYRGAGKTTLMVEATRQAARQCRRPSGCCRSCLQRFRSVGVARRDVGGRAGAADQPAAAPRRPTTPGSRPATSTRR